MMRALSCALVLALYVVPAHAETRPSSFPLTIVYRFDNLPSETAFRAMTDEIGTLMGQVFLRPEWRDRSEITSSDTFGKIILVDFRGVCRSAPVGSAKEDERLGWAEVVDGRVLPFVGIECSRVQAILQSNPWGNWTQITDVALGRAVARVLAHELYHVLTGTTLHSRSGIGQPELSQRDLSSTDFTFTAAEVDRILSAQVSQPVVGVARAGRQFVQ